MKANTCERCGTCCRYIVLHLDARTAKQLASDDTRRYNALRGITVDDKLRMWIPCRCAQLDESNMCGSYAARPQLCRDAACIR